MKHSFTYILANRHHTVFYTGVTSCLERRIRSHKAMKVPSFTSKYRVTKLVYYQNHLSMTEAIAHEKYLKGKSRMKKLALIGANNPTWKDLYPPSS